MTTEPPKPLSPEEIHHVRLDNETLRLENEKLRATNERLREDLQRLGETQSRLVKAHNGLADTFRRLIGKNSKNPSDTIRSAQEAVEHSQRLTGKGRDKPDKRES